MILDDIKTLLNIPDTSKDNKLNIYLRISKKKIKQYLETKETLEEIEINYPDAIILFVVELYKNRDKRDNVVSEGQGSRSTSYKKTDIPDCVKSILPMPYIKLI